MTGADGGAGPGSQPGRRWDVALSFAAAQRDYVERVARALQARGVRCFYDADEQIDLWGKYLAEELPVIYGEQAAAVVVFVSAEYAARDWTRLERRAALNKAVRERREYVLPARFDDTPLPGLLSDMVAIDLRTRTPQQFAAMITRKLAALAITAPTPSADAGSPAQDLESAPPAGAVRAGEADPRRHDTLHVRELDNLTTGAKIRPRPTTAVRIGRLAVFLAIVAAIPLIVVPIISRSYGSPSSRPSSSPPASPSASPSASVSPAGGAGGTMVHVSGSGFPANARVDIDFSGDQLGITTTNGDGKFSNVAVIIPTGASDAPDRYVIDVVEEGGGADFMVPFTVPRPSVSVSPASGAGGMVVRVSASSFPANTQVDITFQAQPIDETTTDAYGKISKFPVTIPTWANGYPQTKFPIDVRVVSDGAISAEKLFTVTG
jgi:TIR domain